MQLKQFSKAFFLLSCLFVSKTLLCSAFEDNNENCAYWAEKGECEKNPKYMLAECAKSCAVNIDNASDNMFSSFYDIKGESDIHGNSIDFNQFRNKVVYIVNVASHCGYTKSNYQILRKLKKYKDIGLEIIIAPCNQFGAQEPGDSVAIDNFAKKEEYDEIILSKADVNGAKTRPLFKYLKFATQKSFISWNFDGKFIVDANGKASHIDTDGLEDKIKELLRSEL